MLRQLAAFAWLYAVLTAVAGCQRGSADTLPLKDAGDLSATDVLPFTSGKLRPGRNYVYCATFDLAWDELNAEVGEAVELKGAEDWSRQLNENPFDKSQLASESYFVRAGRVDENIVAKLRQEMSAKFPNATMSVPPPASKDDVYIYAYLAKSLRFPQAFETLDDPVKFQASGRTTPVEAFGVKCFSKATDQDEARSDQVRILDYVSDDDFILEIYTRDRVDRLALAEVPPEATLAATIDAVRERIASKRIEHQDRAPRYEETLAIPLVGLFVEREFDELVGKHFLNAGWELFSIGQARQAIRFRLDEEGAEVESVAEIAAVTEEEVETEEPIIRKFIFNKPFLILLNERNATDPYFAAWIANAEILQPQ